jgi:hypothetical protein
VRDGPPPSRGPQLGTQPSQYDLPHVNLAPLVHAAPGAPPNLVAVSWGLAAPSGAPSSTPKPLRRRYALSRLRGSGSPILRRLQRNSTGMPRSSSSIGNSSSSSSSSAVTAAGCAVYCRVADL